MKSTIARKLKCKYETIALLLSDEKPEGARQFQEGKWGCVMFMLGAAAKGETAVFDKDTFGCQGGGVGLGFGNQYKNFAGGEECFKYFLSTGNENWQKGREVGEQVKTFMRPEAYHHFMHGERYYKSPDLVQKFIDSLPITDIPSRYVILKPLKDVDNKDENLQVVIFLVDMDQLSALTVLANYGRGHNENVFCPFAAGCQAIGIYPMRENQKEEPRGVIGLIDISARVYLKRILKEDVMSFAAPAKLFHEMEKNLPTSFLEQDTWNQLQSMKNN